MTSNLVREMKQDLNKYVHNMFRHGMEVGKDPQNEAAVKNLREYKAQGYPFSEGLKQRWMGLYEAHVSFLETQAAREWSEQMLMFDRRMLVHLKTAAGNSA